MNTIAARHGDSLASQLTLESIAKDLPLREQILQWASRQQGCWCDTELWRGLEAVTRHRIQRNVIARARGRIEETGRIVRVGEYTFEGRPGVVHFEYNKE